MRRGTRTADDDVNIGTILRIKREPAIVCDFLENVTFLVAAGTSRRRKTFCGVANKFLGAKVSQYELRENG
ncbi:hypothetical protein QE152_g7754 [Popillia japonica]|uniref:Uncharacterized protein n=1 Tax=Popillia japonica TaxID=7064 RepID=A0AAW1M7Z0_POPJA